MLKKMLRLALVVSLAAAVSPWVRNALWGYDLTIDVTEVDVVETCNPGFESAHPNDLKVSTLTNALLGPCGGIKAETGVFHLVGSYQIIGSNDSRNTLIESLRVGCKYDVRIVGFGPVQDQPIPRNVLTNIVTNQAIWNISRQYPCP